MKRRTFISTAGTAIGVAGLGTASAQSEHPDPERQELRTLVRKDPDDILRTWAEGIRAIKQANTFLLLVYSYLLDQMSIDEDGGVVGQMPHISGTRVSVHHVVRAFRDRDYTPEEIADRVYPHLSEQQVIDAITWVLDNQEEYQQRVESHRSQKEELKSSATGPEDLDISVES